MVAKLIDAEGVPTEIGNSDNSVVIVKGSFMSDVVAYFGRQFIILTSATRIPFLNITPLRSL